LVSRIAPGVPERLIGDPLRLRQILTNLLGNAIKFTECGEILLEIEHSAISEDLVELRCSIADTGIGIPADKLEAIFRNFTQADSSTTRKYGGSGLGLAIAHRLVDLIGGRISVQSEPGKGSRFSFNASFGRAAIANDFPVNASSSVAGYRLLVADHSRTDRLVIHEMLDNSGAEIDEVSNGTEALSSIIKAAQEGRPYQFVLLDMAMPSLDGFEVARHVLGHYLPLKSMLPMLSSDRLKPQITRLQQLGLATYLIKPLTRKKLLGSIETLITEAPNGKLSVPEVHAATHSKGARILVAEDSPDNRLVIAAYLRRECYQLDLAEDGKQAFGKFIANPYDLVLMDIQMPEMDGFDTTRAIRRWESEHKRVRTPIVALTAYALEEDVRRALSAGCNLHISKPLKKQALMDCIQKALELGTPRDSDGQTACSSCS
jgi:CheY-like chemotaxis protein